MSAIATQGGLSVDHSNWDIRKLGDVLKVRNGFAFKSTDYQPNGVLLVRQSNLGGPRISLDKAEYLPTEYLDSYSEFVVRKGDILIGMSGSIGKLCIYDRDEPALQNQRTGLLRFKDLSFQRWIWHYLPLMERKLLAAGKGVGVQNVSASQIEALPLPVAPEHERERIVAEIEKQFSRLDEAVANLKRVKANLKRYKAAVLNAAVEGQLVPTEAALAQKEGRAYETGSDLLKRILSTRRLRWTGKSKYKEPPAPEQTELGAAPEGWAWVGLEQLTPAEKHALKAGPFGSALKKEFYTQAGYKIYGQEQVIRGDYQFGDYFIDEKRYLALETCAVKPGDVLISLVGTTGKILVLPEGAAPGIINPRLVKVSTEKRFLSPDYLAFVLESPHAKAFFKAQAHGGTMEILNLTILKALPLPLPPLAEQRRIVDEIDRRLSLIRGVEAQVDANLKRTARMREVVLASQFSMDNAANEEGAPA